MAKYMIIDGNRVEFDQEKNMLAVILKAGIILPTFCYYSDLSVYGACSMCIVENEWGGIMAACSTPPKDKAVIRTNTPKLHKHRKMILELLLANHNCDCAVCEKNGNCRLQDLASRFGLREVRFPNNKPHQPLDLSSKSIVRDPSKCILCGDCVRMCSEVQHVGAIDLVHRGSNTIVSPEFGLNLADTDCVNCGQCSAVCPTAAITIKSDINEVWKALYDPKKRVVAQVAPAVRVAIGEKFGFKPGENVMGKTVACMRRLGFDEVYDTCLGADLTVMEEAAELLRTLKKSDRKYPLFTSCCPAWVRFAETKHPDIMPYVSTCKSPMEMFSAVLKTYYREEQEDDREVVSVAVMPCTAKKSEAAREEFMTKGVPDVDYVLTTVELISMIKEVGLLFDRIDAEATDMPFALHSGSGVIFGATGGVMEAAVRRVVETKNAKTLKEIEYMGFRGMQGVKVAEVPLGDSTLRVAIVSGLGNADELIEKIKSGEEKFDFVEVMACPGGCVSGAGQPFSRKHDRQLRAEGLYQSDKRAQLKSSDDNPLVANLYEGLLKNRTHELLHVEYPTAKE